MVSKPHNFKHVKDLGGGTKLEKFYFEKGEENLSLSSSAEFQKYIGKMSPFYYVGYDHKKDMKNDNFLESLSPEEKNQFDEEMKKIWKQNKKDWRSEDNWFMVLEPHVALYQDSDHFKKKANFWTPSTPPDAPWSLKSAWFEDLGQAKNFIQMARDEEGAHFGWPRTIEIVWKNGPITRNDKETFAGFEDHVEEEEESD